MDNKLKYLEQKIEEINKLIRQFPFTSSRTPRPNSVVISDNDATINEWLGEHADTHKHGGTDEVAQLLPAAYAIPKANASANLNDWITTGLGIGDMLKSTYDTNNDGVVDRATIADSASAVNWNDVSNKPGTYPPTKHDHQNDAGGGTLDHGLALTGLGDDDHTQYLNTARHDTTTRHTLGTVVPHDSHGSLSNLSADDHTQYLNTARHDTTTRHTLGTVVPHDSHGSLSNLSADDHTQYLNTTRHDTTTRHTLGTVVPHDTLEAVRYINNQISGNIDFNKYKAIAMACDNGATLPTTPATGQWFLHTPTGRKVLMQYTGSAWQPIITFGGATFYVDDASGTDAPDKGYGTGANAFKTIQYTVDQIPGFYSGNIAINVAAGNYAAFTVRGKFPTGDYYININGTLQTDYTGTITSGSVGSAENHATITVDAAGWTDDQWIGYLAYYNGERRVIRTNTADTLTLVGKASSTPAGTLLIQSQATVINSGAQCFVYTPNTTIQYMYFNEIQLRFIGSYCSSSSVRYSKLTHSTSPVLSFEAGSNCSIYYNYIYFDTNSYYWIVNLGGATIVQTVYGVYVHNRGVRALSAIRIDNNSTFNIYGGQIAINNFAIGIDARNNSLVSCQATLKNLILNCTVGISVVSGSQLATDSSNYYSGCTTDKTVSPILLRSLPGLQQDINGLGILLRTTSGLAIDGGGLGIDFSAADTWSGVHTFSAGIKTPYIYPLADATTAIQVRKADLTTVVLDIDTTNGRLGINNNAPASALHVSGDETLDNNKAIFWLTSGAVNDAVGISRDSSNALHIKYKTSNLIVNALDSLPIYIQKSDNTTTVQIHPSGISYFNGGNLAIGKTSASFKLDVSDIGNFDTAIQTPKIQTGASTSLNIAPTNHILLDPAGGTVRLMSNRNLQSDNYVSQTTGWRINYIGEGDFRYLFSDELYSKTFMTDLEQALAGGQIVAKSVAVLAQNFALPTSGNAADFYVDDLPSAPDMAIFQDGDFIAFRQYSRLAGALTTSYAWGTVSGYADQADGTQKWTFTRSTTPGTATGTIYADALVIDYGVTGNGYYEVNAIDGTYGANSPYTQIVTWATHPTTATVNTRLGNLFGIFGVANEYGLFAGDGSAVANKFLRLSNSGAEIHNIPLSIYDSGRATIKIDPTVPSLAIGSPLPTGYSTKAGIWFGNASGTYKARIGIPSGDALLYDGSTLRLQADNNNYVLTTGTSIQFFSNAVKMMELLNTPAILVGQTGSGKPNTYITDTSVAMRLDTSNRVLLNSSGDVTILDSGGVERIKMTNAGVITLKEDAYNYLTLTGTSLQYFAGTSAAAKMLEFVNTPAITIGQVGTSNPNTYITAASIAMRLNTSNRILLNSSGDVILTDSSAVERIKMTNAGVITLKADNYDYLTITGTSLQYYAGTSTANKVLEITNAPSILIGQTGAGLTNTYISSAGIALRLNTSNRILLNASGDVIIIDSSAVERIKMTNAGVITLKEDAYNYLTLTGTSFQYYAGVSSASKVFEIINTPEVLIGNTSNANVRITASDIYIRKAAVNRIELTSAGVLNINDATGANVIQFSSDGNNYLLNKLLLSGASSALSIGATPPTSSSAGTGIWIDKTGLYSLNANNKQVWIDATTGALNAANGGLKLDINGLVFMPDSIFDDSKSIRWGNGNAQIKGRCDDTGLFPYIEIRTKCEDVSYHSYINITNSYGNPEVILNHLSLDGGNTILYGSSSINLDVTPNNYGIGINETYIGINGPENYKFYYNNKQHSILGGDGIQYLRPLSWEMLSALWFFERGYDNGTVYNGYDASHNKRHLTCASYDAIITKTAPGVLKYFTLDGTDDYYYRNNDGGLNLYNWFMFGAWIYLDGADRNHGIARSGVAGEAWYINYVKPAGDGYFEFGYYDADGTQKTQTTTCTTTGWHFIGYAYRWTNSADYYIRNYLDGTWSANADSAAKQMRSPTGNFELGRAHGTKYLKGALATAFMTHFSPEEMEEYYWSTKPLFI